jgi:simple sugar transport system permease protein
MGTVDILGSILTISLIATTLRMTTPTLFATLGGIFSAQAGIFNVGLEGLLTLGAFFAVVGSVTTGSPWGGLAFAVASCLIASLGFAFIHLELGADEIIVGLALNFIGYGLTNFLLVAMLDSTGFYQSPLLIGFETIRIPVIESLPIIGNLLSGHFALVYLSFISVALVHWFLYNTPWGFHLRAVGENQEAALAVGINVRLMKYFGLSMSGVMCAFGGAFLSLAYLNLFSEGMPAGRGWLALAAINFGEGKPVKSMVAALIFGFTDALAIGLQQFGLPSQIVLMLPYVTTLVVLVLSAIRMQRRARIAVAVAAGAEA